MKPDADPRLVEKLQKFGQYAWQNGDVKRVEDAKIHMLSHAVHYGTGAFEGIRCHATKKGPAIFRLQDHLRRLMYSIQCLELDPPHTIEEWTKACRELIRLNGFDDCYLRPFVYSGLDDIGLTPSPLEAGIATRPWKGMYQNLKGQVSDVRRLSPKAFKPDAKISGHYVNSINANADVQKKRPGSTAIMLENDGVFVAEVAAANIYLGFGNEVHLPDEGSILPGITRDTFMKMANAEGVKVVTRNILPSELTTADEVFVSGTAAGIVPMVEVNGTEIHHGTPGKFAQRFSNLYKNIVGGEASEYAHLLTYIRE